MYVGTIYKDYPGLLFDKEGNQLDPKTRQPLVGAKTKTQLDAARAAAADAAAAAAKASQNTYDPFADIGKGVGGADDLPPIPSYPPKPKPAPKPKEKKPQ